MVLSATCQSAGEGEHLISCLHRKVLSLIDQLLQTLSQQLARVRIHVERVIGLIKNRYTIVKGPLPVHQLKHHNDKEVANIDKILTVYAALCNLSKAVVPSKYYECYILYPFYMHICIRL